MALSIKATRWPWQEPATARVALLNPRGARFGGGWQYKFGVAASFHDRARRGTVMLELLFGILTISWGYK